MSLISTCLVPLEFIISSSHCPLMSSVITKKWTKILFAYYRMLIPSYRCFTNYEENILSVMHRHYSHYPLVFYNSMEKSLLWVMIIGSEIFILKTIQSNFTRIIKTCEDLKNHMRNIMYSSKNKSWEPPPVLLTFFKNSKYLKKH
jgi:hypothetical protein